MKEVDYISSTFLRMCIKLANHYGQEHFSLIEGKPTVFLVLKVAGLSGLCK